MQYLIGPPDRSMQVIDDYLSERLRNLNGKDRDSVLNEFKEWLANESSDGDEIWTIPDLTDDGLRDFFKRAISRH